ncbi:MAG: hypothetical protein HY901_28690 [Deltaproteobacteria bacterium]|nr:hypothetical protein [Deltaproteobacteria bacterium]
MPGRSLKCLWQPAAMLVTLGALACGEGGGCAGSGVEPIPGGFQGTPQSNAAVVRLSRAGFDYLNANWKPLISNLMPAARTNPGNGDWLDIPLALPCTHIAQSDLGDKVVGLGEHLFVCDNGRSGLASVGAMDGQCTGDDAPCPVVITLRDLLITPQAPDKIGVVATVSIDALRDTATGAASNLLIDSSEGAGLCAALWRMGCFANFYSSRGDRPDDTLRIKMQFSSDELWNDQLTFDMVEPDPANEGELIGGIDEVESGDLEVGKQDCLAPGCADGEDESMCGWLCSVANWSLLKKMIFDYVLKPQVQKLVAETLDVQRCRTCNPEDPAVLACPAGSTCQCLSEADCEPTQKVCKGDEEHQGRCVPRLLGFEGRVRAGELLAAWGGDPASKIDLLAMAGGEAPKIDTALQTPMVGGVKAVNQSPCVPQLAAPPAQAVPPPTLEADAPADYHVGVAMSQDFLSRLLHEAHQSGSLCLNLESAQVPMLNSGLFKMALPSLGVLSGSATQDAPMRVVMRPLGAPQLKIGEGTYDPTTKKPIKPLVTLEITDLRVDIYALIEDRYARLFTLAVDVRVPVSLVIEGCPMTVLPALGDFKQMIVIRKDVPGNAELLAEDPAALTQLIPVILGMAEPVLAASLKPFSVPDMNGFRVRINQLKGVTRVGQTDDFHYLGAYATLGLAGQCASWGPAAKARLVASRIPEREQMALRADRPLPWPVAVLEVSADDVPGRARPMEYAWRLDGGFWSTWLDGPRLEVEHPALVMPGRHRIEVRARIAGEPALVGPPGQSVTMVVDWEPPRVSLRQDLAHGLLISEASDSVSPPQTLRYAYRVGEGPLSSFGALRPIDLQAVAAEGSVEVHVVDEAGLVGMARWEAPHATALNAQRGSSFEAGQGVDSRAAGCSVAGSGMGLLALSMLPWALRRRRA